jgi:hypothetical protein
MDIIIRLGMQYKQISPSWWKNPCMRDNICCILTNFWKKHNFVST